MSTSPAPSKWVRDQVATYEASGGTEGQHAAAACRCVVVTSRRRQERQAPQEPGDAGRARGQLRRWSPPRAGRPSTRRGTTTSSRTRTVELQDGPEPQRLHGRALAEGEERAQWWERAVEVWPAYADYQTKTDREIPVFVAEPA